MGLRNHFATENHFRSRVPISQPISQLRNEGMELRNGTRVPRGGFTAAKPPAKWGCGYENVILRRGGFRSLFTAAK